MPVVISFRVLLLCLSVICGSLCYGQAPPQVDLVTQNFWYNKEKTAKIQIFKGDDGKYCGKIAWLKVPDKNGKPKVDGNNPDKTKRNDPILGLVFLKGLKKESEKTYVDGTIYDPENGKTYSCKLTVNGDKLSLRGYMGISLLGRSTVWTRAD